MCLCCVCSSICVCVVCSSSICVCVVCVVVYVVVLCVAVLSHNLVYSYFVVLSVWHLFLLLLLSPICLWRR